MNILVTHAGDFLFNCFVFDFRIKFVVQVLCMCLFVLQYIEDQVIFWVLKPRELNNGCDQ